MAGCCLSSPASFSGNSRTNASSPRLPDSWDSRGRLSRVPVEASRCCEMLLDKKCPSPSSAEFGQHRIGQLQAPNQARPAAPTHRNSWLKTETTGTRPNAPDSREGDFGVRMAMGRSFRDERPGESYSRWPPGNDPRTSIVARVTQADPIQPVDGRQQQVRAVIPCRTSQWRGRL
jgi:hypothetical protein